MCKQTFFHLPDNPCRWDSTIFVHGHTADRQNADSVHSLGHMDRSTTCSIPHRRVKAAIEAANDSDPKVFVH